MLVLSCKLLPSLFIATETVGIGLLRSRISQLAWARGLPTATLYLRQLGKPVTSLGISQGSISIARPWAPEPLTWVCQAPGFLGITHTCVSQRGMGHTLLAERVHNLSPSEVGGAVLRTSRNPSSHTPCLYSLSHLRPPGPALIKKAASIDYQSHKGGDLRRHSKVAAGRGEGLGTLTLAGWTDRSSGVWGAGL